jgi:uncharacterized protein
MKTYALIAVVLAAGLATAIAQTSPSSSAKSSSAKDASPAAAPTANKSASGSPAAGNTANNKAAPANATPANATSAKGAAPANSPSAKSAAPAAATANSAATGTDPHATAAPVPPVFLNGLPEKPGYVSWRTLAEVSVKREKDRMVPTYNKAVAALDNKPIKIEGFMIPLDPSTPKEQKHFVLTALPQSCSFCLPPVGMEGIVEVKTSKPVPVTLEPVRISGTFRALKDDPMGLYYRITEAQPIK